MLRSNPSADTSGYTAGQRLVEFYSSPLPARLYRMERAALLVAQKAINRFSLSLHPLSKAERLAQQFDDMRMMGQAIEQGCRQAFAPEDLDPIGEF